MEDNVETIFLIKRHIDSGCNDIYSVPELAELFEISTRTLQGSFFYHFNVTPKEYLTQKRLEKLRKLIQKDTGSTGDKIYSYVRPLDFSTDSGLCNFVKRNTGLTFSEFYKKKKGRRF